MKEQLFYIHGGEAYVTYEDFLDDLRNKPLRTPKGVVPDMWHQTLREGVGAVSYTHLTLPTMLAQCRSRWSPYH